MSARTDTFVFLGDELAQYNFGADHPFGPARHAAFADQFYKQSLDQKVDILNPVLGTTEQLLTFHTPE